MHTNRPFLYGMVRTHTVSIFEDAWICVDLKKVLWLPWEYRPICLAVKDGNLALGHEPGVVSFISLRD